MDTDSQHPSNELDPTPSSVLWGRFFWFFIGPAILLVLTMLIVNSGSGWLTVLDIAFFVVVGMMILGRWIEVHSGRGKTAYNDEPATPTHFRRYVAVMVPLALAIWTVANAVGNRML